MLSNPLQRYSPYSNNNNTNNTTSSALHSSLSQPHHGPHHSHNNLFQSLNHDSHYGLHHHVQQQQQHHHIGNSHARIVGSLERTSHPRQRTHQSGSLRKASGTSGPVRRRISRACDQCNQLRTKCDGKLPCAHCVGKFSASRSCARLLVFSRSLTPLQFEMLLTLVRIRLKL